MAHAGDPALRLLRGAADPSPASLPRDPQFSAPRSPRAAPPTGAQAARSIHRLRPVARARGELKIEAGVTRLLECGDLSPLLFLLFFLSRRDEIPSNARARVAEKKKQRNKS